MAEEISPPFPWSPNWRLLTRSGFEGGIGGDGEVFGTAEADFIDILSHSGEIHLDASFNRGGDVVRLAGNASSWTARIAGSSAVFTDELTSVFIPIGPNGLTLDFADGVRTLIFDNPTLSVKLGNQVLAGAPQVISAPPQGNAITRELSDGIFGQVLLFEGGEVVLGGGFDVFGTTSNETVTVNKGHVHFDASFNRGGDAVILAGDAGSFTVEQTGSSATFVNGTIDASLPAGEAGMGVEFDDGIRTLLFDNFIETLTIGAQTILSQAAELGASPDTLDEIVLFWNDAALDAIAAASAAPPVAARALAIQGIAVLDAIAAIGATDSYLADVSASGPVDLNALVSYASHTALKALIPSQQVLFDARLAQIMPSLGGGVSFENGRTTGTAAAQAVLAARTNDGSVASVTYTAGTDPGDWAPTPPGFAAAALPHWGDVDPFALDAQDQFRPAAPPALDSAAYAAAVNEVKSLGSATSTTRTADQTQIARFWIDGGGTYTPPGHWNAIAAEIASEDGRSIAEHALMFAMLNVAMADAGIAAWDAKYTYNEWRPIAAIRSADTDGNAATEVDFAWNPLISTPNHPTYVSGHSTFSSAAANVLTAIYGEDYRFLTGSQSLADVFRWFDSFEEAAAEAGMSRIYGGIHFMFDNVAGLALGDNIGAWVIQDFIAAGATGGVQLG